MNVLHISTFDLAGGAARAAYRIHNSVKDSGVNSQVLVRSKSSNDQTILTDKSRFGRVLARARAELNMIALHPYPQTSKSGFSPQWFPDRLASKINQVNPDIVNLHWVSNGYLCIETLSKLKRPIVWTLMDMWPFTGGCHYTQDCDRYTATCGSCPQLYSQRKSDLSYRVWQRKMKAWKDINLTIVSPTSWLAKCAESSSLFRDKRIEVIPFCLDTDVFKPLNKAFARDALNLPQDKQLVLFGAIEAIKDRRKGFHLLQPALQMLEQSDWKHKVELVVFGSSEPKQAIDLGFNANYLGKIYDDTLLALIYSAADVMVVPSTQEAFGQTASEAISCGTPVVAFKGTGLQDIVDHQHNGYLAVPFDIANLASGVAWVLENRDRREILQKNARQKALERFSLKFQANQYISLYEEILSDSTRLILS